MKKNIKYVDGIRPRQTNKKEIVEQLLEFILTAIVVILAIDSLFFIGWALSGQNPVGDHYLGAITANLLQFIFK